MQFQEKPENEAARGRSTLVGYGLLSTLPFYRPGSAYQKKTLATNLCD